MEIFELRESIDDLKASRDQEGAKNLLLELKDTANRLCDTIEVLFFNIFTPNLTLPQATFQSNDLDATTRSSVKLKYISKVEDSPLYSSPNHTICRRSMKSWRLFPPSFSSADLPHSPQLSNISDADIQSFSSCGDCSLLRMSSRS